MTVYLHHGDLPEDFEPGKLLAIDTETMGLQPSRDRLCMVQVSSGDGDAHLVKFARGKYNAPVLCKLLSDPDITKIFHFARFDVRIMKTYLGVTCAPVYCTRMASRMARTYGARHSLREVCKELIGVEIDKQQQLSDWGADELSENQLAYAAADVLYLHAIKGKLDEMLEREGRMELARKCFDFIPVRAELDLMGWAEEDLFAHSS